MSGTNIFLHLSNGPYADGKWVEGESQRSGYLKWIQLESLSWEVAQKQKKLEEKVITTVWPARVILKKHVDLSSTRLMTMMKSNVKFAQARIDFAETKMSKTGTPPPLVTLLLTGGYIEKVVINGNRSDLLVFDETVELSFTGVKLTYHSLDAKTGLRGGPEKVFQPDLSQSFETT